MSYLMNPLVAAGIFGRTNMGQPMPSEDEVASAIRVVTSPKWGHTCDAGTMMEYFCQQFIETAEHEEIFTGEIESWHKRFLEDGTESIQNIWPEHWALYQRAMNTMEDS